MNIDLVSRFVHADVITINDRYMSVNICLIISYRGFFSVTEMGKEVSRIHKLARSVYYTTSSLEKLHKFIYITVYIMYLKSQNLFRLLCNSIIVPASY